MHLKTTLPLAFLFAVLTMPVSPAQNAGGNNAEREQWRARRAERQQRERNNYAPLELHGMIGSGDNLEVSITNPETKESQWVRVRDKNAKWYVESANPIARSVVVRLDGIALKLDMISNTGEPMSIAPQPTPLSAEQVVAEQNKGVIRINGLTAKDAVARAAEMQKSGQRPSQQEMQAFGQAMQQLTPEQRTQFFNEFRDEAQKSGLNGGMFGGPRGGGRDARNAGNQNTAGATGGNLGPGTGGSTSGTGNNTGGGRSGGGRRGR